MTRYTAGQRGATQLHLLITIIAVLTFGGFAMTKTSFSPPEPAQTLRPPRRDNLANLVRGYLAVAVGRAKNVEATGGLFSRQIDSKEIYLPGVDVYLDDPQTGNASKSVRTDLSGRFSLYAPQRGRYRLCWKSKIYGSGCTPVYISAGGGAQFLSTVDIRLPARKGYVAVTGNVKNDDGSSVRTFEPMLNINVFATVRLDDSKGNRGPGVYVNNFGDYLIPYVPIRQKVELVATIESAKIIQEIRPEARIEVAPLHQVNLKFTNNRPRIDPLVAFDANNKLRVQNALVGSKVNIEASARDKDGDRVKYVWFVDSADGQLSLTSGPTAEWQLPPTPGRYTVTVVAYDDKGGYDKAVLSVLAEGNGVPFTGIVVDPSGSPVNDAAVEIVGNPVVKTNADGRFETNVKQSDRYVFNVRKDGYALNSRVYDGPATGGRWILRPAQVQTIDPTKDVRLQHKRTERDCPGPDSRRGDLGLAKTSLEIPQWQDGKGNIVDPPRQWTGPSPFRRVGLKLNEKSNATFDRNEKFQPAILPRDLKLRPCGPGVQVEIPANSILDPNGNLATAPIRVALATVDLLSPQQMPGDGGVVSSGGRGGYLESYGAGSLDLPDGFKLKPGSPARVIIPVDRSRLTGSPPAPTVPLLTYDEDRGLWIEEDTLSLTTVSGVQSYVGRIKHFTVFNADTVVVAGAACVRVFSQNIPGNFDLEVITPYPDGTPHYKKYAIDNITDQEHVIYNITPNVNITLAPMTQGANTQLLGFYIVNSGPPQTPPTSPNPPPGPPYTSCQNFVVIKAGSAPDAPFGGEFLHGLGFIDAANLGGLAGIVDDLTYAPATGNAVRDVLVTASRNYYSTIDPTDALNSFEKFKAAHGFSQNPATPGASEIVASYANSGDLGFGRDMHCIKKGNNDVVCYVSNYGDGYTNIYPGGGTDDHNDADAAASRSTVGASSEVATVAMEYSDLPGAPGNKVVKFYVYKKALTSDGAVTITNPTGAYSRSISANLDGRGERPVPQLCMICHGGQVPQQTGGVPAFGNNAQVTLGAKFLPFDHRFFTSPSGTNPTIAAQEAAFKALNEQIVVAAPPSTGVGDPVGEVVSGMYNNGSSATQIFNFTVPGWVNGASANAPNQSAFYQNVVANGCRSCHMAQPFPQLQLNTSDRFVNLSTFPAVTIGGTSNHLMLGTTQLRVCGDYAMPHAFRTHEIFWGTYTDIPASIAAISMPLEFQNFGDGIPAGGTSTWKTGLCTSFITESATTPSQFYQHTIQAIWNAKCVGCHIVGSSGAFLPLTEGVSHAALVPGEVVPGNDNPAASGNELLRRLSFTDPRDPAFAPTNPQRMPKGCAVPPAVPTAGQLPCLTQQTIDTIKAWIRSGAN